MSEWEKGFASTDKYIFGEKKNIIYVECGKQLNNECYVCDGKMKMKEEKKVE